MSQAYHVIVFLILKSWIPSASSIAAVPILVSFPHHILAGVGIVTVEASGCREGSILTGDDLLNVAILIVIGVPMSINKVSGLGEGPLTSFPIHPPSIDVLDEL